MYFSYTETDVLYSWLKCTVILYTKQERNAAVEQKAKKIRVKKTIPELSLFLGRRQLKSLKNVYKNTPEFFQTLRYDYKP